MDTTRILGNQPLEKLGRGNSCGERRMTPGLHPTSVESMEAIRARSASGLSA